MLDRRIKGGVGATTACIYIDFGYNFVVSSSNVVGKAGAS